MGRGPELTHMRDSLLDERGCADVSSMMNGSTNGDGSRLGDAIRFLEALADTDQSDSTRPGHIDPVFSFVYSCKEDSERR